MAVKSKRPAAKKVVKRAPARSAKKQVRNPGSYSPVNSTKDRATVSNIPAPTRRAYDVYESLLARQQAGKKLSLKDQKRLHDAGTETLLFERKVGYSRLKNQGKTYKQKHGV